ncbi:MAG: histidine kinase [Salibacteraceae bacterium]
MNLFLKRTHSSLKFSFAFCLFLINITLCFSQNPVKHLLFFNYGLIEGLPSQETYDIMSDSKGFIWIATDNGIARFNGTKFEVFTTNNGLTDNTVFRIKEDHLGRIWCLTYNRKICYFENNAFHTYPFNDVIITEFSTYHLGYTLNDIEFDSEENLHLLIEGRAVLTISKEGRKESLKEVNPHSPIIHNNSEKDLFRHALKKSILINKFKKFTHEYRKSPNDQLTKAHLIKIDSLYFLGTNTGLKIYQSNNFNLQASLLPNNTITGVCHDFEGGLWCSSLKEGVFYFPNTQLKKEPFPDKETKKVLAITEQRDKLILSFHDQNLEVDFSNNSKVFKNYPKLLSMDLFPDSQLKKGIKLENSVYLKNMPNTVQGIAQINDTTIIELDHIGLYYNLNLDAFEKALTNQDFQASSIFTSFHNETFKYSQNKTKIKQLAYPYKNLTSINQTKTKTFKIFIDKNNTIWLGTINGLKELVHNEEIQITRSKFSHPFTLLRIQDINQANNGDLFFGTRSMGLFYYHNDSLHQINDSQGLLSNKVNTIVYDSIYNLLFVSSNLGVSILKYSMDKWVVFKTINKNDGLLNSQISSLYLKSDTLLFTTNKDLFWIPVTHTLDLAPPPIIELKNIIINQTKFTAANNIVLTHDSNNLDFSYSGLSFKTRNNIRFSYRLTPLHTDWRSTKSTTTSYNSLPSGSYTFEVKAINIEGTASEIKNMSITIEPAFWMTLWFKGIIVLIVIVLLVLIAHVIIKYYQKQTQIQKSINELQIMSLQAKMNPHFIFNSLNSIQNFILKNEKEKANDYLLEFSKLVRIILQNSKNTKITIQNEFDTLAIYVDLEVKRLRKKFEYKIEIDASIDTSNALIPSLLIQPYVENAIWHGKVYENKNGIILIQVSKQKDSLYFQISDNGIGVDNSQKLKVNKTNHHSLGSEIAKKRIQLLSELNSKLSEITVTKLDPKNIKFPGTIVSFSIPYVLKNKA